MGRYAIGLLLLLTSLSVQHLAWAADYGVVVRYARLIDDGNSYQLDSDINYQLSSPAKEALHKGIPLIWNVQVEVRHPGLLHTKVFNKVLVYQLLFNALLNQYEVKAPKQIQMFLSLDAALEFMAQVAEGVQIDKALLNKDEDYQLAVKVWFDRERLPIPLRPVAWLDGQWFLSSDWYLWSITK